MELMDFMIWVVLVALSVSFIRTLMMKWGITEYLEVHSRSRFFVKMLRCEFCTYFWLGVLVCIPLGILHDPILFLVPVFSCNLR